MSFMDADTRLTAAGGALASLSVSAGDAQLQKRRTVLLPYSTSLSQRIQCAESNKPPSAQLQSLYTATSGSSSYSDTLPTLYLENKSFLTQSAVYGAFLEFKAAKFRAQALQAVAVLGPVLLALLLALRPSRPLLPTVFLILAALLAACLMFVARMWRFTAALHEHSHARGGQQRLTICAALLGVGVLACSLQCLLASRPPAALHLAVLLAAMVCEARDVLAAQLLPWDVVPSTTATQVAIRCALAAACRALPRAAQLAATLMATCVTLALINAIVPCTAAMLALSPSWSLVVHVLALWKLAFALGFVQVFVGLWVNWALTQPISSASPVDVQKLALACVHDGEDGYAQLLGWRTALTLANSDSAQDRALVYQTVGQLLLLPSIGVGHPAAAESALYLMVVAALCRLDRVQQSVSLPATTDSPTLADSAAAVVSTSVLALTSVFVASFRDDQRGVARTFLPVFVTACTDLLLSLERFNAATENCTLHSALFRLQELLSQQLHRLARAVHGADQAEEMALPVRVRPRWHRIMAESRPQVA